YGPFVTGDAGELKKLTPVLQSVPVTCNPNGAVKLLLTSLEFGVPANESLSSRITAPPPPTTKSCNAFCSAVVSAVTALPDPVGDPSSATSTPFKNALVRALLPTSVAVLRSAVASPRKDDRPLPAGKPYAPARVASNPPMTWAPRTYNGSALTSNGRDVT